MKTTINVTREHIKEGERGVCNHCPVALAIESVCAPRTSVSVSNRAVVLIGAAATIRKTLPYEVQDFIKDFDTFEKVRPFSFDLDIPDELLAEVKA